MEGIKSSELSLNASIHANDYFPHDTYVGEETKYSKRSELGPKNNFTAILPPTVTDDADSGYSLASRWVNTVNGKVYTCIDTTAGAAVWVQEKPDWELSISPGAWDLPSANYAPFSKYALTNGDIYQHLFDDTTEEFIESNFIVPSDIDPEGTVTIEVCGFAATAAADKWVQLAFYHSAAEAGEDVDIAYTQEKSGDKETDSTQDYLDYFTWTETVSNLGWEANDQVRIKVSRIAVEAESSLVGDYGITNFRLRIPRA